jgi:8-amino-7-oxononanoate synthase
LVKKLLLPLDCAVLKRCHVTVAERKRRLQTYPLSDLVDFSSNDTLGISKHPLLVERAIAFTRQYGVGSRASRLLTGNLPFHEEVEAQFAAFKGCESALLFPTGFQANVAILSALIDRCSVVLMDRECHYSLLAGAQLSHAKVMRYAHNSVEHLDQLLNKYSDKHCWVVTESLFGMDGSLSPLADIDTLTHAHGASLYVDEAHAIGIYGACGRGLAPASAITLSTCGKAMGCFGAFIGCSADIKEQLINQCGGFIYTTAPPPAQVGAIAASIELVPTLDSTRAHVIRLAERLDSDTHIVSVTMGSDANAVSASDRLRENGILALPIRPPTVPKGTSRLRISLNATHSDGDIDRLRELLCTI